MAKTLSRNAFLENKRKFDARLQRLQKEERLDEDAQDDNSEDVFQLQHHHMLACLERITVINGYWSFPDILV